jgi:enoyl-[acyl-carrier-protein] reductase (NADH)
MNVEIQSQSLPGGRKSLVVGIANENSIAYDRARMFRNCGAELAVTRINDKTRSYVEPLARELAAPIMVPLDTRARAPAIPSGSPA